jgi:hypothetical protein
MGSVREAVVAGLARGRGLVFAEAATVHRPTYCGRSILAPNSSFSDARCTDARGYVPVEWWIMSATEARNDVPRPDEGLTALLLPGPGPARVFFRDALAGAADLLLGDYAAQWPLTKILDIGGPAVQPSFPGAPEVPPIPAHVHAGDVVCGRCQGGGKLEAYFFPPLHVPPCVRNPAKHLCVHEYTVRASAGTTWKWVR